MIRRVLLGLLALWLGGCARCASKVEFESFVSVPTELAAVGELDDPPDVVVKVEKRAAPKGGGGGCGHSPVCLIIIPFAVAEALFPEKLRIATVSEKGRETYHGVFRENGQFVQALAFVDGLWRKIALLQLPELGRNLVVEVAHSPADAEGMLAPATEELLAGRGHAGLGRAGAARRGLQAGRPARARGGSARRQSPRARPGVRGQRAQNARLKRSATVGSQRGSSSSICSSSSARSTSGSFRIESRSMLSASSRRTPTPTLKW